MQPILIPVTTTAVNWSQLLQAANKALGRPLTAHLDAARMGLDGPAAWVAALGGLRQEGDPPGRILADAGPLLKHCTVGFFAVMREETLTALLEDGDVAVTSGESVVRGVRAVVITGTLEQWRTTIINGCSRESSLDLRAAMDAALLHFERMGLGAIWSDYQKKSLTDTTFALERKT